MKWRLDQSWLWLVLIVAAIAYYRRFLASHGMEIFPQGAECMLQQQVMQQCAFSFTYPPAFAFVMIPLVPAPLWLREIVWYLITIGVSVAAYRLSERVGARLFARPFAETELVWVRVIVVILSVKFVLAVLENQAYDTFALIFILLGLVHLAENRDISGGAALGFATAIKATPLVFLPYLLVRKRFKAAAAFLAVLVIVSALPDLLFTPIGGQDGYLHAWLRQIAGASFGIGKTPYDFWNGANALNHSLHGAVSLRIDEALHPLLHKAVIYALDLVFVAFAAALLLVRRNTSTDMVAIDGSVLLIAMLMLSPMTSRSHYVVLILAYTVLTMVMLRDQVAGRLGATLLGISFFFLTATSNDVVGKAVSDFAYAHSFLVIGALVLLIYIGVIVWNPAVLRDAKPFVWKRTVPAGA